MKAEEDFKERFPDDYLSVLHAGTGVDAVGLLCNWIDYYVKEEAINYAKFCIRSEREGLPLLEYDEWNNKELKRQRRERLLIDVMKKDEEDGLYQDECPFTDDEPACSCKK